MGVLGLFFVSGDHFFARIDLVRVDGCVCADWQNGGVLAWLAGRVWIFGGRSEMWLLLLLLLMDGQRNLVGFDVTAVR